MVKKIKMEAFSRTETNGKAKNILRHGFIPAVLYGPGTDNKIIKIKRQDFEHVLEDAGETHLIDLSIDGEIQSKVLIKDTQRDIMKNKIVHADLYQVNMKKEIELQIPLHFTGEAKAVKELGGTLVKNIDALNVKCLPGALVDKIEIDISILNNFNDAITIKDIIVPEGIEVLNNPEDMVAHVMETIVEEEIPVETAPEGEVKTEAESSAADSEEKKG